MIAMSASQAAYFAKAQVVGEDVSFTGISIDSRSLAAGNLFVAIRGDRFDGHDFAAQAMAQGAAAALVSEPVADCPSQIVCQDTRLALGTVASAWAAQCGSRIVGVTGSNGKTTIKSMLYEILQRCASTLVNEGNFNNEIGLPLTMARMSPQHRYAILEMGASKPGDIQYLAQLAQPEVGIVSNASLAHTQGLGGVDQVALEKGALFAALPEDGCAIINADDAHYETWCGLATANRQLSFGYAEAADVRCVGDIASGALTLVTPVGRIESILQVPGRHNLVNAAAAAAAAIALDIPSDAIAAGLANFGGVSGRLEVHQAAEGWELLDDSYNANPASLQVGIEVLAQRGAEQWLVLGDMAELGAEAAALHEEAGRAAKAAGLSRLYAIGSLASLAADAFGAGGRSFDDKSELVAVLLGSLRSGVSCLIKGSRSAHMEEVAAALVAAAQGGQTRVG